MFASRNGTDFSDTVVAKTERNCLKIKRDRNGMERQCEGSHGVPVQTSRSDKAFSRDAEFSFLEFPSSQGKRTYIDCTSFYFFGFHEIAPSATRQPRLKQRRHQRNCVPKRLASGESLVLSYRAGIFVGSFFRFLLRLYRFLPIHSFVSFPRSPVYIQHPFLWRLESHCSPSPRKTFFKSSHILGRMHISFFRKMFLRFLVI